MAKKTSLSESQKRKPRLLWANPFCLMDTSSGASMSVRKMLHQLVAQGYDVQILGATIFDNPKGMRTLKEKFYDLRGYLHQLVEVEDELLTHQLVVTQRSVRPHMTAHEEGLWYSQYNYLLDTFKPDVVWFYGGQVLDLLISNEARARGIPSAAYLVNQNYMSSRWCRDVDLIVTDTQATSEMYRRKVGFFPQPVGKFIDANEFVAKSHERERLLFINPSWPKGASVFVQLAEKLERERPDIVLEVVEARADWSSVLRDTTQRMGCERSYLNNVQVTPNTSDMCDPYSRARVLVAPSLWWESGARVLAESMLNGIPAIVSDSGGNREMVKEGGWVIELPPESFEKPYKHLLNEIELQPLFDAVVTLFDDDLIYESYVEKALNVGRLQHSIEVSTNRLTAAFLPLVKQRAGNKELQKIQSRGHKHKLLSVSGKPEFNPNPIPVQPAVAGFNETLESRTPQQSSAERFGWQFKGKVIALDNRAKLIRTGQLEKLLATNAFGIVAFDPASEVQDVKQYEGSDKIQVFQHALLGDGTPGTLYTCLAPEMSSNLKPLPADQLPEERRRDAQVITKLPINTIKLDNIEGLESLDWLILDELSDAISILEHGKEALKEALLIQARVAFQPTHEQQASLDKLQHWASCNDFRFYRFNDASYQSLFPKESEAHEKLASELQSLDALFLPSQERLAQMDDNRKQKLVFLLHTVFDAHDMAYQIMSQVNELLAKNYLRFVERELSAPVSSCLASEIPVLQTEEENAASTNQVIRKQAPDAIVAKYLPDETLNQPGSIRWLIEKERQFGGLQRGVVRNKTSRLDPRKPHQYSAGFVKKGDEFLPTHIGGDRMSMNYHGYSIAYSTYLLPLMERKQGQKLTIVEVGILRGTGLAIWCDLFPSARVIGLDLDPSIFEQHRPVLEELGAFQENQPEVYSFDQFEDNCQKMREILAGNKIDVFIDDGAHTYDAIMKTLDSVKPMLSDDFIYFIEDFKGIEGALKKILKKVSIFYAEEMTVVYSKNMGYPARFSEKRAFLQSLLTDNEKV